MKIDLHSHIKLSKKTEFTIEYFQESIQEARLNGLNAIAMTEHFNTHRFYDIYEQLDRHYTYKEDYYDVEGFKLFPGMEVDVKFGGHILVIGMRASVLELRSRLEPHTKADAFVPFEQLLDWCDELSLLRIGAHPHRESNPLTQHDDSLLRRLDAFDLNAKDMYTYGPDMKNAVADLAHAIGIPVVAGSDTHHPLQFGSIMNQFDHDYNTVAELAACIKEGRYHIKVSPCLETKVKAATWVKKILKQSGNVIVK
ncbi:histidinol-phosphatase [Paenibacillus sp. FSL H8-0548]|uniref:PHP-associated domain-containing protein n=1 Tax=Paenibacillus sp. FSL H8-0548 TaxID=1920422 RepID=UPI00096D5E9E|nr:PHP-associated domain-containing protein [Paenibacillus sp. FSL H8-0548]OMF27207.1 histidinol-phosphatase [Paenibacillus sp. FSL H8-0548]